VSNYRPISLFTSFSKIFETIIFNRLITHITSNKIVTHSQFCFRNNSSTEKSAYKLINVILTTFNDTKIDGSIFFDLEKDFDCVNHDIVSKNGILRYKGRDVYFN